MAALLEQFVQYRGTIQYFLIFALTAWAFARGDGPERWTGVTLSAAVAAAIIVTLTLSPDDYADVIWVYFVGDTVIFAALAWIAMRANRIYPLCILAAQLIVVMMHFQREIVPAIPPLAYYVLTHGPSWVQVIAFAVGMVAHRRRMARYGSYRSWRTFSGRSSAATLDR